MNDALIDDATFGEEGHDSPIHEARRWRDDGWTATIIKNGDDDGWAVEMTLAGEDEPALVGPWTMGRDKKNPKPLDAPAFHTLVKTASEVLRRHEQQLHAQLHKSIKVNTEDGPLNIKLDIIPEEDDAHALLSAYDSLGEQIAEIKVAPTFKLNMQSATQWIGNDFKKLG